MPHFTLTTERLAFREMTSGDLDFIASLVGDPETMRFYPEALDREGAENWLDRVLARYAKDGYGFWLVENRHTHEPIGQVGLLKQLEIDGTDEAEIGYQIHRDFWRQGYAREATRAVCDYAFARSACRASSRWCGR